MSAVADEELDAAPRRRTLVVAMVVIAPIVLIVWAVVAAGTAYLAYTDLDEARVEIIAAERALRDADLSTARERLEVGVSLAGSSSQRLARPYLWPLRYGIPVVSPNLRAATALSDAARDSGGAAADLLEAASTIVHDDREAVRGEISVDYLTDLAPPLQVLADVLDESTANVASTGSDSLLGPVERARETYLEVAGPAVDQAVQAAELARVLPSFLGEDEPRTYLLGAASLSELRASGGLIGSWALLRADGGHLDIGEFVDIDALGSAPHDVDPPSPEFADRYAGFGALHQWRNTNLTPHFPDAAQVMLDIYEAGGHGQLDGVIMADPVTFEQMVRRSGDIEVPGITTLTPQSTLQFVGLDAYAAFDDDDVRKAVLGSVAAASFERVFAILEDDDVPETVRMLYDLAGGGHLRVYARDPEVQGIFEQAGVAGAVPDVAGEFAGVYVSNVAANKVDYFTHRSIHHHVSLAADGLTRSSVEVTFTNDAPREGYPRHVLGPWTPHTDAGDNLSRVTFLCGFDCEVAPLADQVRTDGADAGRPAADVYLRVPAGESRRVDFVATTPGGWRAEGSDIVVDLHHHVQPTLFGTDLQLRVTVPDGWDVVGLPGGAEHIDGDVVWDGTASGTVDLSVRLAPSTDGDPA